MRIFWGKIVLSIQWLILVAITPFNFARMDGFRWQPFGGIFCGLIADIFIGAVFAGILALIACFAAWISWLAGIQFEIRSPYVTDFGRRFEHYNTVIFSTLHEAWKILPSWIAGEAL